MGKSLHCTVVSREGILFSDNVDIITLPGSEGSFALLVDHAPIVSLLKKGDIKIKHNNSEKIISIKSGIIENHQNSISILVEI